MGYRVKFYNPATGQGFIDQYRTARRAKQVAAAYRAQFAKDNNTGVTAQYMGRDSHILRLDESQRHETKPNS